VTEQNQYISLFLDLLPNQPKDDKTRESFKNILKQRFEANLTDSVERIWDLPPIAVNPEGEYLTLLQEARQLYLMGSFYSCVAMCGIVGERLIKDVFRASVLINKSGSVQQPSPKAFDQFERIEVHGISQFLKACELLSEDAAKAAKDLRDLRNQYAHARGKAEQFEALKAIKFLHVVVEDTVSVFKRFTIKDGVFVPKS
jgi:hypothetical protein